MSKLIAEKIQRDTHDILVVISDEEEIFRKKFFSELGDAPIIQKCTICSKNTGSRLYPHPALRVTVCFTCYHAYEDTIFIINRDGTDTLCRWCGKPADKYSCSKCTCIFCSDCLERNFGEIFVHSAIDNISNEWSCLICYPKQLWGLRAYCIRAMDYQNSQTPTTSKQSVCNITQDVEEEGYLSSSPKTNHTESSAEIIASPKKIPKPIDESDDDELSVSQNTSEIPLSQNSDCAVQLSQKNSSCSQNELLSENQTNKSGEYAAYEMFSVIKGLVDRFIFLFDKENKLFEKKAYTRENCVAYKNVEKIISKVHLFCDQAQKNLSRIDSNAHAMFENWSKKYHASISDDGIISSQEETTSVGCSPLSETSPASKRCGPDNSASVSRDKNIVPKPSTSSATISDKKTCKKQFNLSLKHTEIVRENSNSAKCKDNNSAETLKQKENTLGKKDKICCSEVKVQLVDVIKFSPQKSPKEQTKSPQKETNEEKNTDNSETDSHSSFSHDTHLWNQDRTSNGNKKRKRKKKQIQIKQEIEDECVENEILHQNIISNAVSHDVQNANSSVSTHIRDTRVEEDFNDGDHLHNENSVELVHYLCDRTGDFIDCYTNHNESSEIVDQLMATTSDMEEHIVDNEYISVDDLQSIQNLIDTLVNINPETKSNVEVGEKTVEENATRELQDRQLEVSEEIMQEDAVFENITQQLQTEVSEEVMQEDAVFENSTQQLQKEVSEEVIQEDAVFENITQQLQTEVSEEVMQEDAVFENSTQQLQKEVSEEVIQEDAIFENSTQQLQTEVNEEVMQEHAVIESITQQLQTEVSEEIMQENSVFENITQQLQTEVSEEVIEEDSIFESSTQQLQKEVSEEVVQEDAVFENTTRQLQTEVCKQEMQEDNNVFENLTQEMTVEECANESTTECSNNQNNVSINDPDESRISEEDDRLADVMRKITVTLDNLEKNIDDMEDKFGNKSSNNDNESQNTYIANTEHDDNAECDKDGEINIDGNENTVESTNTNEMRNQNETNSVEINQETTLNTDNIIENGISEVIVNDSIKINQETTLNTDSIIENGTSNVIDNDTDNIVDCPTDEVNDSDNDDDDDDSEYKREAAYAALLNDNDDISSDFDISSDESSDESTVSLELKTEHDNSGYIKELNIEQELQNICSTANSHIVKNEENIKTEQENISDTNNSDTDEDLIAQHFVNDPKLLWKCSVAVDRINFQNCYGLVRVSDSESYRLDSDNEEDEIRRLTNLKTLKRRATSRRSSGSSSDTLKTRKRFKNSDKQSDETSSSDSDETLISLDDDGTDFSPNTNAAKSLSSTDLSEGLLDDLLMNTDSEFENAEDYNESRVRKKSTQSNNDETTEKTNTDENILEQEQPSDENRSNWRKDKLLTSNINFSDDSDATNDSTANRMLKERETKSSKSRSKEDDGNDTDLDALSSSLGSESDDDCIFDCVYSVDKGVKRSLESISDDDEPKLLKKGRRNIKEVMSDDLLQEETKLADKEEEERKERIAMKHQSLDYVLSQSSMSEKEVGLVLDVDEVRKEPVVSVHPVLTSILKKHQCDGIKFMWDVCFESVSQLRHSNGAGCILAHCMGLGKTMQIVVLSHTLITHPVTNVKHILVVCPLSTVYNWKNEYEMSMNKVKNKIQVYDVSPHSHKKLTDRIYTVQRWRRTGGVLLIGYESYQTLVMTRKNNPLSESNQNEMQLALVNPGPDLVVCDEGHMLKNDKTARFKSLINLKTKRRIILTGTPLQNNLTEYYYMVKMVKPHLLGTINEYANRFVNPIMNGQYENSSADDINLMRKRSHVLHKKLETTVQRFEVSELEPYLPEKYDYVLFLKLSPLQIKLYQKYLELVDVHKALFKNFHALQNIWTHPALLQLKLNKKTQVKPKKIRTYDEDFVPELDPDSVSDELIDKDWFKPDCPDDLMSNVAHGPKMQILFSIISECQAIGDKLLVFSSSITELDLIEYFLKQRTLVDKTWIHATNYFRMDGTVAPEVRMKYCNAFNNKSNKEAMLFLVSHKVGGLGLNLVAANRVVLMDVSWNPAYDIQSVFRIYRFGQEQQCFIYRLVSMGTMEEVVHSRAVTKLAISGRVVDERQINRHFRSDDLQKMYQLNIETKDPPRPTLPYDRLLAKLWDMHNPVLYKFHDHESMLENLPHEELNEEEMKLAWEEFHNEEESARRQAENIPLQMADLAHMFSKGYPMPGSSSSSGMHFLPVPVSISQKHNILNQRTTWNPSPSASNLTQNNFNQPQILRQPVSFLPQNNAKPIPSTSNFPATMSTQQINNSNTKPRFIPNRFPDNLSNIRNGSGNTPGNTPIRNQPSSTLRPNENFLNGTEIRPVNSLQHVYRRSQSVPGNNDPNVSNPQQQNIPNSNNPNPSPVNINPQTKNWFKPNGIERLRKSIQQNVQRNKNQSHMKPTLVTIPNPNNAITIPPAHSNSTSRLPHTPNIASNHQTPPPAHSTSNYARLPSLTYNPASLPTTPSNNANGTSNYSRNPTIIRTYGQLKVPGLTNSRHPNPFKQTTSDVVVNPVALQSKNQNVSTQEQDPLALDGEISPEIVTAAVYNNPIPNRRQSDPEHFRLPNIPSTSNTIHSNTAAKSKSTVFGRSLPKFAQKENVIDYVNKLFETRNDNLAPEPHPLKIVNVTTLNDNSIDTNNDFQPVGQDGAIQTTFNKPAVHRRDSTIRHSVIHNNLSTEVIELE